MQLRDKSEADLRAIIEEAAQDRRTPAGSEARKIGDLYASFMDEARAEQLGLEADRGDLARIDAIADKAGAHRVPWRDFSATGVGGLFGAFVATDAKQSDQYIVYLNQGGISLPDESYYRDAKFKPIREEFVAHVEKMFELAGIPDPKAAAAQVMAVETGLAKNHWDRVKSRDRTLTYNKMDRKQLDALTPGFDWTAWFDAIRAPETDRRGRRPPARLLHGDGRMLDEVPLDDWKTWLKWHVLHDAAPLSEQAVRRRGLRVLRQDSDRCTEIRPRWKRGVALVEASPGRGGRQALRRQALPARGQGADEGAGRQPDRGLSRGHPVARLDEPRDPEAGPGEARQVHAQDRLSRQVARLLRSWRSAATTCVGNVRRAAAFEVDRNLAKLGKPVDRDEWGMTPQTVNAYYNPGMNEIVFPAAILQPPFFDMKADDAVNYGAIGAVIGHEIGHGFDDQGSKFDGDGNMNNWWTDPDRKEFETRAKMLIEQYNGFEPVAAPRPERQRRADDRREHRRPGRPDDRLQGLPALAQRPARPR